MPGTGFGLHRRIIPGRMRGRMRPTFPPAWSRLGAPWRIMRLMASALWSSG